MIKKFLVKVKRDYFYVLGMLICFFLGYQWSSSKEGDSSMQESFFTTVKKSLGIQVEDENETLMEQTDIDEEEGLAMITDDSVTKEAPSSDSASDEERVHDPLTEKIAPPAPELVDAQTNTVIEEFVVNKNATTYETLMQAGLEPSEIISLLEAAKPIKNLANIQVGTKFILESEGPTGSVNKVEVVLSPLDSLLIEKSSLGRWSAHLVKEEVTYETKYFEGKIKSNLWLSAADAGLPSQVIYLFTEIFAWQIDFEREIRPGDSWRIAIEKSFIKGKEYGWGNILAAEYKGSIQYHQGVRFPLKGEIGEYYTPNGENLKGKFLKSPLRFSRISSKFQLRRFHPVLKINRPHYGVDYAAAQGTPVRSVGDGVIKSIGRNGGAGKTIRIRHNAKYETAYKHLSKYRHGLKRGSKVTQGQIIGYVGSTGLATGPHLHFEFYENGHFKDPLGSKFPREKPVATKHRNQFKQDVNLALSMLDQSPQSSEDPTVIAKQESDEKKKT